MAAFLGALGVGALDVGLLASALTLSFLARRDPESSWSVRAWAIGGATCLLLFGWAPDVLPTEWSSRWISVVQGGVLLIGCCALLRSAFLNLPSQRMMPKLQGRNAQARSRIG